MKLPVFHKYFSTNIAISITMLELLLFIVILIFFAFPNFILFCFAMLNIFIIYATHLCLIPLFTLLSLVEFFLRKKGRIIKTNIVNIPVKLQKYICLISILIYVIITIVGIIAGQPMSEEELRFD